MGVCFGCSTQKGNHLHPAAPAEKRKAKEERTSAPRSRKLQPLQLGRLELVIEAIVLVDHLLWVKTRDSLYLTYSPKLALNNF